MNRRAAREMALKILFARDLGKAEPFFTLDYMGEEEDISEEGRLFILNLVQGVIDHLEEIDKTIVQYSREWAIDRLAAVERNLLRIALYEILYVKNIPKVVAVNESIELAKIYGSRDSFRFVNGILGSIIQKIP